MLSYFSDIKVIQVLHVFSIKSLQMCFALNRSYIEKRYNIVV